MDRIRAGTLGGSDLLSVWNNQHPVGAQIAATWLMVEVFGLHLKPIVYLSFALILATGVIAWRLARAVAGGLASEAIVCLSCCLLAFHPTQMEHLLWAFELGWFMVNACVVANVALIERWRERALVPVCVLCLVATFSSAQGALVWFAAALQVALLPSVRRRWIASAPLACCGIAAAGRIASRAAAIGDGSHLPARDWIGLPSYVVQIFGTALGTRGPWPSFLAGSALVTLTVVLCARLARSHDPRRVRCGVVLTVFAALCVVSFAGGRFPLGLDWALGSFHAAPLLVPLDLGVLILLVGAPRAAARGERSAAIVAVPLALLLATGVILSWSYGLRRARLWTMDRSYAVWAACRKAVPFETAAKAAGAEPYGDAFAAALPSLSSMCTDDLGALGSTLTREPALFERLATSHPEARGALEILWQDYATERSLQLAFDPAKPDTPSRLLALAKAEAHRGSPFDHGRWAPVADVLLGLP